eukprot:gene1570-3037_t
MDEDDNDRNKGDLLDEDELQEDDDDIQLPGVDDLPLFADAEVRKVDLDVKEKEKKIDKLLAQISEMKERVKVMREHSKNVQQEVEHTNALSGAKKAEIQSEKHLSQMASRALARAKAESITKQNEVEKLQEQLNTIQNNIYKANEKMDEYKLKMNWNQEELEQWAVAAKQKEEDSQSLQKYTRADEFKVKELTLQIEQLAKELVEKQSQLDNDVTDTQAKQMELDRIADEFRETHKERQRLVTQWQETIEAMKQRDGEINHIGERYSKAKQDRVLMETKIDLQRKRLESQISENHEVEAKAELLQRLVARKREEYVVALEKLEDFRQELEALKNTLTVSSQSLISKRAEIQHLTDDIEQKRVHLERERSKLQDVKHRYEAKKLAAMKTEQTAKEAEEDLQKLEKELITKTTALKELKDSLFRETQKVHNLKQDESILRAEINGSRTAARNLDAKLSMLDKEAGRQQELLYNAEFQIQQIERKVARGLGERSDEEKKQLKQDIDSLEQELQGGKDKMKMLTAQIRKLQNEVIISKVRKDSLISKNSEFIEKIRELELETRTIEEEIKHFNRLKEDETVTNDVLKLEVRRLKDLLAAKSDAVFSLENRKQQLLLSLEERKQEICVHSDVLKAELRSVQDEKHAAILDLRNRELAVEKLKAKYSTACQARGETDGQSQTYFLIQAAQKREELQRKGDELDASIRKAEREIRALQTTLDHLNARNTAYRTSFQKVDKTGEEGELLRQLEERTKLGKEALFRKKKELQRLVTDYDEDNRRLEQVRVQTTRILKQKDHLEGAKSQVEEELLAQQVQLDDIGDRLSLVVRKQRDKAASKAGVEASSFNHGTLEEKSVRAEVLRDVAQNVLYTLGQLSAEFPEVANDLAEKLQDADLKIPNKPPARMATASIAAPRTASRGATQQTQSRGDGAGGGGGPLSARSGGDVSPF